MGRKLNPIRYAPNGEYIAQITKVDFAQDYDYISGEFFDNEERIEVTFDLRTPLGYQVKILRKQFRFIPWEPSDLSDRLVRAAIGNVEVLNPRDLIGKSVKLEIENKDGYSKITRILPLDPMPS